MAAAFVPNPLVFVPTSLVDEIIGNFPVHARLVLADAPQKEHFTRQRNLGSFRAGQAVRCGGVGADTHQQLA